MNNERDAPTVGAPVDETIRAIVVAAVALRRTGRNGAPIDPRLLESRMEAVDRAAGVYLAARRGRSGER
jgi:hypothetical protein